ncbi:hypothetical protein CBOM_02424 [Ceraceosorus bombacis]|uniref:Tethering factor for nuclear proteasome STS1 n=1 Tax=Ceraceosorus bombacis TaxID=401625 RepID=A0A0P1BFA2_9BASI|nr:hypothetical protein CBOM_02424 [Ceraceosorus bombacis]
MPHTPGRGGEAASLSQLWTDTSQPLHGSSNTGHQHLQQHAALPTGSPSTDTLCSNGVGPSLSPQTRRTLPFGSFAPAPPMAASNTSRISWGSFGYTSAPSLASQQRVNTKTSPAPVFSSASCSHDSHHCTSNPDIGSALHLNERVDLPSKAPSSATRLAFLPSSSSATAIRRKRGRNESVDMQEEDEPARYGSETLDSRASGSSLNITVRLQDGASGSSEARQVLPKRMRSGMTIHSTTRDNSTEYGQEHSTSGRMSSDKEWAARHPASAAGSAESTQGGNDPEVDLGKLLAMLDRPSLLVLLSRLLAHSTDSTLPAQMLRHMPTPSIATFGASLDECERQVRAAIPNATNAGVRAEWAWSRIRNPLQDFVTSAIGFFRLFDDTPGSENTNQIDNIHPSTTFSFLHDLTERLLRIQATLPPVPDSTLAFAAHTALSQHEYQGSTTRTNASGHDVLRSLLDARMLSRASPNTLISQLAPYLLHRWSTLLERISGAVNEEGRIFGQDMINGWLSALQTLGCSGLTSASSVLMSNNRLSPSAGPADAGAIGPEERAIRQVLQMYHRALVQQIGWLVGVSL